MATFHEDVLPPAFTGESSNSPKGITVALLTRNRLQKLKTALEAIRPQLEPGDQVLILDTGSTDGTLEYLSSLPPNVRALTASEPLDFASARNTLVQATTTRFLLFTDDDCYPARDLLARMREFLHGGAAVGGACLPARLYPFPRWWSPSVGWAVGFSTVGFLQSNASHYPATSNLASPLPYFDHVQFGMTSHSFSGGSPYAGGREDATWWRDIRVNGFRTAVSPKSIVFHDIPAARITFPYVLARAHADGVAWWERQGDSAKVPALRGELACSYIRCWMHLLAGNFPAALQSFIWLQRNLAAWHRARTSANVPVRREATLYRTLGTFKDEVRRSVAREVYKGVRRSRMGRAWPPQQPNRLYVAAEGYVGDTVMLRPLLSLLAHNFASAEISVSARTPQLLGGLPPNISVHPSGYCPKGIDAAIVPYYVFGSPGAWKRQLSQKAVTFDSDVGFPRDRYYNLARQLVYKDVTQHELHNLLHLFSLWPLEGELRPPELSAPAESMAQMAARHPQWEEQKLVTVQLGAGQSAKSWPWERFAEVTRTLAASLPSAHFAMVGDSRQMEAAETIGASLRGRSTNLCGCSLEDMIGALSASTYHIGACSAPMQIASALGTPTFTLYGPTEPERWGALFNRKRHAYVRATPAPLTLAEYHSLPIGHLMELISVEKVVARVLEHMETFMIQKPAGSIYEGP